MYRKFLPIGLGILMLLAALSAEAQQPGKVPRIGYLSVSSDITSSEEAFKQGLRELGYIEGQNIVIERVDAEGNVDRMPGLTAEVECA